jgi:hypothetical protein
MSGALLSLAPWNGFLAMSVELEALLFGHAPDDAPLAIHHRIGVGEVARHLDPGALDLADALAEIAAFGQRDILRAALGLP